MMNDTMYRTVKQITASRVDEARQQRKVAEVRAGGLKLRPSKNS